MKKIKPIVMTGIASIPSVVSFASCESAFWGCGEQALIDFYGCTGGCPKWPQAEKQSCINLCNTKYSADVSACEQEREICTC